MVANHLLTLTLSLATVVPQTDQAMGMKSLVGISSLSVGVEELGADALTDGLSEDLLKTDVELRLRLAGIKVPLEFTVPCFQIQIKYWKNRMGQDHIPITYNFHIAISLMQYANLFRTGEPMTVVTMQITNYGSGPIGKGSEHVRRSVGDLIDKFINEYLAVNPKK
jgi:hypothetical protein